MNKSISPVGNEVKAAGLLLNIASDHAACDVNVNEMKDGDDEHSVGS